MEVPQPNSETFGKGSFVGDILKDPTFFELSAEDQARYLGQRAGCPVVEELIDPNTGRGPESMVNRYGEVNFWYGYIKREMEFLNRPLAERFEKETQRKEGEPAGKFEPESVPENYTETMAPINNLAGFSLPRMLIEQMQGVTEEERQQKLTAGLKALQRAIRTSKMPMELMAKTAESFLESSADKEKIVKQMLGQGWLEEHNAFSQVYEAAEYLKYSAPKVWEYYSGLSEEERSVKGLVSLEAVSKNNEKEKSLTLDQYLKGLQAEGISTLTTKEIKDQLDRVPDAIITREFVCGIRISKITEGIGDQRVTRYRTWTTNDLEDRNHPLAKKYGWVDISLD